MRSIILTSIQFACLGILLATNPWITGLPVLTAVQATGLALGIWAILVMSRSRLNVTPVPLKGAVLITGGPYRIIRHPMYTSLILIFLPILIVHPDLINIVTFAVLAVNLYFKLMYEEKLLRKRFEGYNVMMEKTWRLVPWIY